MTSWLIVAGDFTPLGGMDAANHGLARYLAVCEPVHLVTHRAWDDLRGPRVTVDRVARPFGHALGAPLLARRGRRAWARLRPAGARAIVNGGNCRIDGAVAWIHYVHAAYRPELAGAALRRARLAIVHRRDVAAEGASIAAASLVICNSRRTRDDVARAWGVDPSRLAVVYYGGDASRLTPLVPAGRAAARAALGWRADRPVVAFVGALGDRRKSFDTVFAAWTRLCADSGWDADLVVIGSGAEQPEWVRRARAAGIGDRVRFLGFRPDVPELLAGVDALVHPARYEAYGLSVREALCRGIPALVTATAGVAEEYDGALADLLLASPDDAAGLAARLRRWRASRACFDTAASAVGARLRARTWDHMAAEIVSTIQAHEEARR